MLTLSEYEKITRFQSTMSSFYHIDFESRLHKRAVQSHITILFRSPEHGVLKVSYYDRLLSVVHRQQFACKSSRGDCFQKLQVKN